MQIDQALLLGFAGVIGSVIALLFRELLKAKDEHITELRESLKYQRTMGGQALGTAHRAVELADKVT